MNKRKQAIISGNTSITETPWQAPKPRKLTGKQQAFIRHIVDNPTATGIQAVQASYGKPSKPMTYGTANSIAVENLQKPAILAELAKYSSNAETTVIEVMNYSKRYGSEGGKDGASYASVALQSANSVLDRLHGKATSKVETISTAVTLNIDLTGTVTGVE